MPLRVIRRKNRGGPVGALTISGTIRFADGHTERVVRRASTNTQRLALEEAAILEARYLRTDWHGEGRGSRSFAGAVAAYMEAEDRSEATKARYRRVPEAVGDVPLSSIGQDTVTRLRRQLLRPNHSQSTVTREILNPLRAITNLAVRRGWADPVDWTVPKESTGRTLYLLPIEAERLIEASAVHLRPLLTFLVCTGARVSEALELECRDVDLVGRRAILWRTKNGARRNVELPPRCVDAMSGGVSNGLVFRTARGVPYTDHERRSGGQFKTAWRGAVRRAGLDSALRPHDLRHTWSSWQYALHKDVIRLKQDGDWSDLKLVLRYVQLLPEGHQGAIREFRGE